MSGKDVVAVRRPQAQTVVPVPRRRRPANTVAVRRTISAPSTAALKAELDLRLTDGTMTEHSASRPHPTKRGHVVVDAVVLEPRALEPHNRTRTILFVAIGAVLLGATALIGYLAFVSAATAIATEAKGLLGCMVIAAILVWAYGRRRSGGSTCGCGCVVIHICRR